VPGAIVPDQLKSGVTGACRYEPRIQRVYEELARHNGTVIWPAKPRDKAKVEVGVQVAERWILARLRNETFFSLDALNERISELCDDLNERVMRHYGESRRQLFERLDRMEDRYGCRSTIMSSQVPPAKCTNTSATTTTPTPSATGCCTIRTVSC
jgi:hypothetical protein